MIAISKINLVNKYNPTKEIFVPVLDKRTGRPQIEGGVIKTKKEIVPRLFCAVGDELNVITKNAQPNSIVIAVEHIKTKERFSIRWEFIEEKYSLDEDEDYSLDD